MSWNFNFLSRMSRRSAAEARRLAWEIVRFVLLKPEFGVWNRGRLQLRGQPRFRAGEVGEPRRFWKLSEFLGIGSDEFLHCLDVQIRCGGRRECLIGLVDERVGARDQAGAQLRIRGKLREESEGIQVEREGEEDGEEHRPEPRVKREALRNTVHHRVEPTINLRRQLFRRGDDRGECERGE